ncbi:Adenosine monophosphate-protein transferase SoFic [Pontiella desulfatans]|uniref:Adenosine monophosphate-protein transferase SoFic n=1 Tax=Pontiella desulfatans TaxID=2750659 RepID=A0A6C2TZP9_PONDE|nr:Fic family protein [Pontiella desulfatans]VGO12646.1 Adenosine monophosphate-protein transferase SoFic [Pontiella desulfatans]
MSDDVYKPPYALTERIVDLVERIGEELGRASVGERSLRLRRANRIRSIHGSVAIEGNTLSEEQVSAILEGKRVIAPPREILEVQNALEAYDQLVGWSPANESDLLSAHAVMMNGLLDDAGRYRVKSAGVAGKEGVIHVAPPADRVPFLMKQLFQWLETTELHPLVSGAVFHYEFEFIHPFADGNGRMGRLWQTLILCRWNSVFGDIAVESMIHEHQQEYYEAINASNAAVNCAPFIEFMLQVILETIQTDQVDDQVSDQVKRLLDAVGGGRLSASELMERLGLSHRPTFRKNYLKPALEGGLVAMTLPDSPRSPTQKYFLTSKGKRLLEMV